MPEIIYRCWNDSSHFIASKYFKKAWKEEENRLKNYESEYVKEYGKSRFKRGKEKPKDELDLLLEELYFRSLELPKKERLQFIKENLENKKWTVPESAILSFIKKKEKLLSDRKDRFQKKAFNNDWNYFVTITYDDSKHDEISFKERLKKCLANLHDRYHYKYMGVFERSETGRLHFHALFYIPDGEMRGEIVIKKDYSTEKGKMQVAHINTFFEKRFGRNDFVRLTKNKEDLRNSINYILKYIGKTNERIFYSRGIPTYLFIAFEKEESDQIVSSFGDFVKRYVLFDDVIESRNLIQMRC